MNMLHRYGASPRLAPSLTRLGPRLFDHKRNFSGSLRRHTESTETFFAHNGPLKLYPTSSREFLVYYSNVYPAVGRLGKLLPSFLYGEDRQATIDTLKKDLSSCEAKITVKECVPRPFEGGCFVKFELAESEDLATAVEKLQSKVTPQRFYFFNLHPRVFQVVGKPWVNDIHDLVSNKLSISYDASVVSTEQLYEILRPYGRITSIEKKPENAGAFVTFRKFQDAIAASNCVYGFKVNGTTLKSTYVPVKHSTPIKDWVSNHPRIFVPMLLTLFLGLAYIVFEPIREFFIQQRIQRTWELTNYPFMKVLCSYYQSLRIWTKHRFTGPQSDRPDLELCPAGAATALEQLQGYLAEGAKTFIIISGPNGSGKNHIVDMALGSNYPLVLDVDVSRLNAAKSDQDRLAVLSSLLGYWPVFLFMNNFTKFIDLGVQSIAGQSSGLSETADEQAKRMLSTATAAIRGLALKGKPRDQRDSAWLDSGSAKKPVIVIRGYTPQDKMIAEWAGDIANDGIAQVIFVTHDAGYSRSLSTALPNRVFQTASVEDISESAARDYVVQFVEKAQAQHKVPPELIQACRNLNDKVLRPLGGRLTDLQAFARLIVAGDDPENAIKTLVHQTALEVSQLFLLCDSTEWSSEQAWTIVKALGQSPDDWVQIPASLDLDPVFKAQDQRKKALTALESQGFISVRTVGGRIIGIRSGRPLYKAAFSMLAEDPLVRPLQDSLLLKFYITGEEKVISGLEAELVELAKTPARYETKLRQDYLSQKLRASQEKISAWEKTQKQLQQQLKSRDSAGSKFI